MNYVYIRIHCGSHHTYIIKGREIYVCGDDSFKQLGHSLGRQPKPQKFILNDVFLDPTFTEISCGYDHVLALEKTADSFDKICIWGDTFKGQFNPDEPIHKIRFYESIRKVVCGGYHHVVVPNSKGIFVGGSNTDGQLGLGHAPDRPTLEKISFPFRIIDSSCGAKHTVILSERNELYVCGSNESGQLGLGDNVSRYKFARLNFSKGQINAISCGGHHTMVVTNTGQVFACGANESGQLGLGDTRGRHTFQSVGLFCVLSISCGGYFTCALTKLNNLYVWGSNDMGQLGLGHIIKQLSPVKLGFKERIKSIHCGLFQMLVITTDDEIYGAGSNRCGQLGLKDFKDYNILQKLEF